MEQQYVVFPALALLVAWILIRRFMGVIRHMARSAELRAVLLSVVALLAACAYVFHLVEGWRYRDALYFCVITLTTTSCWALASSWPS